MKQKQQLAKHLDPLPESKEWLEGLNEEMSFVHLEKDGLNVSKLCQKANKLLDSLDGDELCYSQLVSIVEEMLQLDREATQWRQKPEWSFRILTRSELKGAEELTSRLPDIVELHSDIWMAYEWNYHRTARIILHQQLLACLRRVSSIATSQRPLDSTKNLLDWKNKSTSTIQTLTEGILASVPQSLGDINAVGCCLPLDAARCQAVGAYLLLWPIKIIKSPQSIATQSQKEAAEEIFERIRECTGMKSALGTLSII